MIVNELFFEIFTLSPPIAHSLILRQSGRPLDAFMRLSRRTHGQVIPQLTLRQLQRRLRQVSLWDGESGDCVVEMEAKRDQPDVDICVERGQVEWEEMAV